MKVHPTDKANGVVGYTPYVGKCVHCGRPANCLFDIGTPLPVLACSQEHADAWWDKVVGELEGPEPKKELP